jgi:hypothetical protein
LVIGICLDVVIWFLVISHPSHFSHLRTFFGGIAALHRGIVGLQSGVVNKQKGNECIEKAESLLAGE